MINPTDNVTLGENLLIGVQAVSVQAGVGTYALITLEDYKSYAGITSTDIEADALSLYCSATDATNATVTKTDDDTLTIVITGGSDAGSTAIDLANDSYDTLGELVTYIDGLSGWTANLEGWSSASSVDLKNIGSTHCLGSDDETTLVFYDNYKLERLIDRASAEIEAFLRRKIKSRSYTFERYDGYRAKIFIENYPISAIVQISSGYTEVIRVNCADLTAYNAYVTVNSDNVILTKDGTAAATLAKSTYTTLTLMAAAINDTSGWTGVITSIDYNAWPSTLLFDQANVPCRNSDGNLRVPNEPLEGYDVDFDSGIIALFSHLWGWRNLYISYTGGYSTVPFDIVQACVKLVKYHDDSSEVDSAMRSEKLGDYGYTLSMGELEKALGAEMMVSLKRYQRRMI